MISALRRVAFVALAALLLAPVVWLFLARPLQITSSVARSRPMLGELVRATGPTRAIEGRLTGGFKWARFAETTRGGDRPRVSGSVSVELAVARMAERAASTHQPADLADHGVGLLVRGDTDAAIATLEESVESVTDVAEYWSDLAAARLARFVQSDHTIDLPRALDAVERSVALTPLPEALFNKALILERLNLLGPAKDAWLRYLDVDADSQWANEARQRRDGLERRSTEATAGAQTQRAREGLADDVLSRWAQATQDADATAILADARRIAAALTESSRDPLAGDLIRAIDGSNGSRETLAAIKAAHAAYGRARAAYKKDDHAAADREFAIAERQAKQASRPLELLTRVNRAIIRYRFDDVPGAIAQLRDIVAAAPDDAYSIKGRSYWILGLLTELSGGGRDAGQLYDRAISALRQAGERPNAAFVAMLKASQLDTIGDLEGAWRARIAAFADTDRESAVQAAAQAASEAGWPRAAGFLYEVVTAMARTLNRPIIEVEAIRGRARALAVSGAFAEGIAALSEAKQIARPRTGPGWDLVNAEIDLAQSECELTHSPADAAAAATRALDYFLSSKRESRFPEVRLARAKAYRALGQVDLAEKDLLAGIDTMESIRSRLDDWRLRAVKGDVIQRSGDQIVTMRIDAGRTDEAFDVAERLRGWTMRSASDGAAAQLHLQELTGAMPADALMAWYYVAADESYVWAIRRGGVRFARIPASRAQLSRLVSAHARGDRNASGALSRLLLGPLAEDLSDTKLMVIVPDGPLHQLQAAALPGRAAKFLIEEHAILMSPSATVFASSFRSGQGWTPPVALVVGNPAFDRTAFPSLREIGQSSVEADAVSAFYELPRLLNGPDASRAAVLAALPRSDVFHFAGHSLANSTVPAASELVVAGNVNEAITAAEISRLSLRRLRLVILSSCQSALGADTRSEGPLGLAQAFLSAGADNVVATLALVADRPTRELSVAFHREFQRLHDPVLALQAAQRALLSSPDPTLSAPDAWAPFVVIGQGALVHVN